MTLSWRLASYIYIDISKFCATVLNITRTGFNQNLSREGAVEDKCEIKVLKSKGQTGSDFHMVQTDCITNQCSVKQHNYFTS